MKPTTTTNMRPNDKMEQFVDGVSVCMCVCVSVFECAYSLGAPMSQQYIEYYIRAKMFWVAQTHFVRLS